MLTAVYSQQPGYESSQSLVGWVDLLNEKDIHNTILLKVKMGSSAIFATLDEPKGHHSKWNKTGTESYILHYVTFLVGAKKLNSKKQRM